MPAQAQAAGAATSTPVIPALQSLINSATVTATPASAASGASAADAASAPSPASQAELARSLDSVIATLDNDRQRTALVTQLKKLRDVSQNVGAAPRPRSRAPACSARSRRASRRSNPTCTRAARRCAIGAAASMRPANELYTIISSQGRESFGRVLLSMLAMLAGWGACAGALIYLQHRLHRRFGIVMGLHPNPTTRELLIFALRRVGPWIIAFVAALLFVRAMPDALGRTLGMVVAYAIVAGAVFSAICLIMFSLFGSGHRRIAVRLLIDHARRVLFAVGVCGALGDAAVNYDVAHQLGIEPRRR